MVLLPSLDDRDPRHKCCCGLMHIRTGVVVIGGLELAGAAINMIGVLAEGRGVALGLLTSLVGFAVIGLLFYALRTERAAYVLPHLVWQLLVVVGLVISSIVLIAGAAAVGVTVAAEAHQPGAVTEVTAAEGGAAVGLLVFLSLVMLVTAGLELWFFMILLRLYNYYREKATTYGSQASAATQPTAHFATGAATEQPPTYQDYTMKQP